MTTTSVPAPDGRQEASPGRLTVAGIRAGVAPVLAELGASARDREAQREHPFALVRELARRQLILIEVPAEEGGAGGTVRDVMETVVDVAQADSNVAQALRASFTTAHTVAVGRNPVTRARSLERLLRGGLFASTVNERGGKSGATATTLRRTGDGYVLNGTKYYSTGGLYADWFSGSAVDEDGRVVQFTVPTSRAGVERLDDFDAVGQRLTASGSTRLDDVAVSADEVVWPGDTQPVNPWGTFPQLYLAAIQAGIAAAVLDDAVWFVREKGRPIKYSTADQSVDDPYVRRVVGMIAVHAHAARSAVLIAAEALEEVRHTPDERARRAGAAGAIAVAQGQVAAAEATLKAAELLFDAGGGSATSRAYNFDRHWRNARTVANHNPRDWKAARIGSYLLVGEEPPTAGLF